MTFKFPSIDHHTLRMSFLSRVMLNVWNLQKYAWCDFAPNIVVFTVLIMMYINDVLLGWGKCTGDNSYDQSAQDFLADFLIRFWGCWSNPSWKQWLGHVAIPSSVGLVLSSCHPFLGAQQHVANLYRAKRQPRRCLKENHVLTLHRIAFSVSVYSQWFSRRACRGFVRNKSHSKKKVSFLGGTLQPARANPCKPTVKELGP